MERCELSRQLWELRGSMLRLAVSILRHPQDAEDAVSAAMLRAFQKADSLRDEQALKPWAMRITANVCYDLLRRRKREREYCETACMELFIWQMETPLLDLILRLPEGTAQVLTLYYYEGFTTSQIALSLALPAPAVRARLSRGRKMLKQMLEEDEA